MSKGWNTFWSVIRGPVLGRHYYHSNVKEVVNPRTAVGVSEFRKLVLESTVIVDKSLLIKDFVESPAETLLLTYPRRWGKSVNLDMVDQGLSIEVDQYGNPLSLENRENSKLFLGGVVDLGLSSGRTKSLPKLKIAEHQDIVADYLGQFPVVSIDFKNTKGESYDDVLHKVKIAVHTAFLRHKYLSKSDKLKGEGIDGVLEKYIDTTMYKELTPSDLSQGLLLLSQCLQMHFGKRVFILMDEYDAAINNAYMRFSYQDAERVVSLFRNINETTFKGNTSLEKGLITGVFRIAKANLFSGLNNLSEYNILDEEFSQYYGFTQEEVEYLMQCYGVPSHLAGDIDDWYNGYNVQGTKIYNPWSLVQCLNRFQHHKGIQDFTVLESRILQSYWEESGNVNFIKPLFQVPIIKSKIDQLVQDEEPLVFNLTKQISSEDFKILREVMSLGSNYKIDESVANLLFSYLFSAGYLTVAETRGYRLPNQEIKTELERKLVQYYEAQYSIDPKLFTDVTDGLQKVLDAKGKAKIEEEIGSFQGGLTKLLEAFPQFSKIKDQNMGDPVSAKVVHANEDLIHSVMSYVTLQLKSISGFGTEVYLGTGRADIVLMDARNQKGMVIEFKYDENARVAIEQIKDKRYANKLSEKMETIIIGVNVSANKVVDVVYEEIPKNLSGQGTDMVDNSYDLPYSAWFNKYYSEGMEKILQLRISDLESDLREKIKILPARYQLTSENTDVDRIIGDMRQLSPKDGEIVLVPYNIKGKHWVGMIFQKCNNGFAVKYIDPENQTAAPELLFALEKELSSMGQGLAFKQELVENQKYNNCGAEVIENFIYSLTGKRLEEEAAVIYHSSLVEKWLLEPEAVTILGNTLSNSPSAHEVTDII